MTRRFAILEHTADVGLQLRGSTREEIFEAAGEGLATLLGAWFPGEGAERVVRAEAPDIEALLAAWIDELLYLHEAEDVVFGGFLVEDADDAAVTAQVVAAARGDRQLEGVGVKAATYHRLRVTRDPNGGWSADVYLDV